MSIGKHLGSSDLEETEDCFAIAKRRPKEESFSSHSSFHSFMEDYETSKLNYEVTFYTQQLCVMLQRIATSKALFHRRKEPTYRLLMMAAKETMLTELEVSAWSIVITRTEPDSRHLDFSLFIRISAFAVRKMIEDDVVCQNIINYLDSKGGFRQEFNSWYSKVQSKLSISCIELNEEFQQLVQPLAEEEKDPVVYAFLIDELTEDMPLNQDVPGPSLTSEVQEPTPVFVLPSAASSEVGSLSFERHPSYLLNLSRNSTEFRQLNPQ